MNIRDGEIRTLELICENEKTNWREMVIPPTQAQRVRRRVGRNAPCPCGSGKKFKQCCLHPTR